MTRPLRSQSRYTGSSRSTRNTTNRSGLWIFLACEDNPKVCTGRRAIRLGKALEMTGGRGPSTGAILLDPHATTPLTSVDRVVFERLGLVAVDCSWNKLGERGEYPGGDIIRRMRVRRRLPLLLAANPQHYGRVSELNTVEALGAALFVLEGREASEGFLQSFSFGPSFLTLNGTLLDEYHEAKTTSEINEIEVRYLSG